MTRRRMSLLSMAVLAPLVVDVPGSSRDSSVTTFMIAAGGGSYAEVTRGCQGEVLTADQRRFRDMGFGVNHQVKKPLEVGVRATVLRRMSGYDDGSVLWNPYVALEGGKVGFGLGYVSNSDRPYTNEFDIWPVSGHLRIGSPERFYFSIHALEDVPLVSGGGAVRSGFGFRPIRSVDAWIGMGTPLPYDKPGVLAKTTIHVNSMLDVNATGRLGSSEGRTENAGSVGLTVRLTRYRKPGPTRALPDSPSPAP